MKPEFTHNLQDLTYDDALDRPGPDWFEPQVCASCGDDCSYCGCRYNPRPKLPECNGPEWNARLDEVAQRINKPKHKP